MKITNLSSSPKFGAKLAYNTPTIEAIDKEIKSNKVAGTADVYYAIKLLENVPSDDVISINISDERPNIENLNTGAKIDLFPIERKYRFRDNKYSPFEALIAVVKVNKPGVYIDNPNEFDVLKKHYKTLFGNNTIDDKCEYYSYNKINNELELNSCSFENIKTINDLWGKYEKLRKDLDGVLRDIKEQNNIVDEKRHDYIISLLA